MIFVTGTKRSGTSLWMQVLEAAGFPYIGSEFPLIWKQSIGEANPKGFYESMLRKGVNASTNPHPKTGRFLFPKTVEKHVVKVFIPGLVRSDYGFINHVVASIRPWREYCTSITRLHAMEDEHLAKLESKGDTSPLEKAQKNRSPYPAELEWWFENYMLIRDLAIRRYPYQVEAHSSLISDPESTIGRVLEFLGEGKLEDAVAVVEPKLHTQRAPEYESSHLEPAEIQLMDDLYGDIAARKALSAALLDQMNTLQETLRERARTFTEQEAQED